MMKRKNVHVARLAAILLAGAVAETTMAAATPAEQSLAVGDPAPSVMLALDDGSMLRVAEAGKPVVIYFYPKDDTPGCTKQACTYRDRTSEIQALGAIVVGVSFDDAASHKVFREKHELPFRLATDDGTVAKAFGVELQEYKGSQYHQRDTIVVGADGRILAIIRNSDPVASVDQVIVALEPAKRD
jgi:peroxiredoxin Q/BCP